MYVSRLKLFLLKIIASVTQFMTIQISFSLQLIYGKMQNCEIMQFADYGPEGVTEKMQANI
jgi:hypothetical protein